MVVICCFIIISIALLRYIAYPDKQSLRRKNFLLLSALIQTLMFEPPTFFSYGLKEDFVLPFSSNVGVYIPTLIAFMIFAFNQGVKKTYLVHNISFVAISLLLAIIISYSSPYNLDVHATNIAFLMIAQILLTIYICRFYISDRIMQASVYDAFQIIIWVQFIVSFAAIFLGVYSLQDMFLGSEKDSLTFTATRKGVLLLIPSGTTPHHNILGGLCAFISVYFFSCLIHGYKNPKTRFLFFLSITTLLLSQSRAAIIASLVAVGSLYVTFLYHKRRLSLGYVVSFIGMFVLMSFLIFLVPFFRSMFIDSDIDTMVDGRFLHYEMGFEVLSRTHWQGIGLNTHLFYINNYLSEVGFAKWLFTRPIHNIHLIVFVELGIIGFVLWGYYLLSRIIKYIKCRIYEMENPVIWSTFFCMIIILLIHGLADVVYFRYQFLMLLLLFGIFYRNRTKVKKL